MTESRKTQRDASKKQKPAHKTRKASKPIKTIKIKPDEVTALIAQGIPKTEIAKQQGVNYSTLYRYLEKIKAEKTELDQYINDRAAAKALLQIKADDVIARVLDGYTDEKIEAMTDAQKGSLVVACNAVSGTQFDKERLERGQSTENVHQIIDVIRQIKAMRDTQGDTGDAD